MNMDIIKSHDCILGFLYGFIRAHMLQVTEVIE